MEYGEPGARGSGAGTFADVSYGIHGSQQTPKENDKRGIIYLKV